MNGTDNPDLDHAERLLKRLVKCQQCDGNGYLKVGEFGGLRRQTLLCVTCLGAGGTDDGRLLDTDEILMLRAHQVALARQSYQTQRDQIRQLVVHIESLTAGAEKFLAGFISRYYSNTPAGRAELDDRNTRGLFGAHFRGD